MNVRGFARCVATSLLLLPVGVARADVIMDWNAEGDAIAAELDLQPPPHGRQQALMHVAMFEAVNAIDRRYVPYALNLVTDRNSSREAAAAAAAHAVLLALYPDRKAHLDASLARALEGVPAGPAKERGLLLGRRATTDLLALRANDGSDAPERWRPVTAPGVYVPTSIPVSSTVGGVRPWVLASAARFRPGPPPALDSATWTRDLDEIRRIGARDSKERTAEQTSIAKFWFLRGPRTFNPLLRQVAEARRLDVTDCARLYALVSLAANDAFIAVFDAKYTYNFWRPVTAIRVMPSVAQDTSWLPLGETPLHPEYPCAHCITAASVAAVLGAFVGDGHVRLTLTSPAAPGVTREWTRLRDYAAEVADARVWAGFHYRFSTAVANDMGRRIGEHVVATTLRPRAGP